MIIIDLLCLAGLTPLLVDDFVDLRPNDSTSAYYLSYGKNLLRYPLSITRGLNSDRLSSDGASLMINQKEAPGFYLDHPPGLTWMVALFLKLPLGKSEIIRGRWVSASATLVSLMCIMYLAFLYQGVLAATIAGLTFTSLPMVYHHGTVINFEPLTMCWMLLACVFRTRIFRILGYLTDWPAYFLTPARELWAVIFHRRVVSVSLKEVLLTFLVGIGLLTSYGKLSGNSEHMMSFIRGPVDIAVSSKDSSLNLLSFAKRILIQLRGNFTPLMCFILALCTCIALWKRNFSDYWGVILSFIVVTFFNVILFPTWAVEHSFWTYFLIPSISLAAPTLLYNEIPRTFRVLGGILLSVSLASAGAYCYQFLSFQMSDAVEHSYARRACPLLNFKPELILSDVRSIYFGHGYVFRWYWDRPFTFTESPSCDGKAQCVVLTNTTSRGALGGLKTEECQFANLRAFR